MRLKQFGPVFVLAGALVAASYGVYRTRQTSERTNEQGAQRAPTHREITVDQSSLVTAEQIVRMPTASDERPFAEDVLHHADKEMDLAFASAVRRVANRNQPLSDEGKEADARLKRSVRALAGDSAHLAAMEAALRKASSAESLALIDRLNLAKAQAVLSQDEVDDAREDLRRAGGDPQGQMQDLIEEHEAASKSSDSVRVVITNSDEIRGLAKYMRAWRERDDKRQRLVSAKSAADSLAGALQQRHDRVVARAARLRDSSLAGLSRDSTVALLEQTRRQANAESARASLDQRIDNQHRLAEAYAGWIDVVGRQQLALVNRMLRSAVSILAILLVAVLLAQWMKHLVGEHTADRRRAQTAYMVGRMTLQVVAVLLILLVIFGPPDNLGTVLGLAGAGLTVALKDFLVAFLGWFVLMGRNGIRIGDLVEIDGVTGEVVQLGIFYTVLLEMGGWTESGHPTGRRVTFTNGFAIEGHYFNFTTSGRWLWDEVRIIVPQGHDPYAISTALQAQVEAATAESSREAELQWSEGRRPMKTSPSGHASVNLKPISGGVELAVRYITRANEREDVRSKLYHSAVDMIGGTSAHGAVHAPSSPTPSSSPLVRQ